MVPTLVTRKCTGANGKASACVAAVMTTKSEEVSPYKIPSASTHATDDVAPRQRT